MYWFEKYFRYFAQKGRHIPKPRNIFIVTYARTGSTALMRILNELDGFCMMGENGGLLAHLFRAQETARFSLQEFGRKPKNSSRPWHGIERIQVDAFTEDLANTFTENILVPPEGTTNIGFKEIRHTSSDFTDEEFERYIEFLISSFEQSRIIFLTRDTEETIQSEMWRGMPKKEAISEIETMKKRFEKAARQHRTSAYQIDHRDFSQDPEGLKPLIKWLGSSLNEATLKRIGNERLNHLKNPDPKT